MAYTRKIKTTNTSSTADDIRKIKVFINNEVKEIKQTFYSDAQRNLTEIFNKDAHYNVTFINSETENIIESYKLKEGSKINNVPIPNEITGMDFVYWLIVDNSYTSEELYDVEINNDVVIVAVYQPKTYTVYYYDYSEYLTEKTATHNSSPITSIEELGIPTPVGTNEVGYSKEFEGWSLSNNNTPADLTNYEITNDITLYACFSKTPINYTIIFDYDTPYDGRIEITRVSNVKIDDNIYNMKPTRPVRYLLGKTSSWHYSNDFSYYRGTNTTSLNIGRTLTVSRILTYADDTTITLSLNYFEREYPQPVLSSFSNITPDYLGNPLVYFENKFIAGGRDRVYYNWTPKTGDWTPVTIPNINGASIWGFAHTNSTVVGFTNSLPSESYRQLVYSEDGITWYRVQQVIGTNERISCIASYKNKFILSTLDGKIYTSDNGSSWSLRSTVVGGFTFGSANSEEQIRAITVTKNDIVIVATNLNTSYCAEISTGTWTWRKIANILSDVPSPLNTTVLMSITEEGDETLGRVLWLKNYGRVFELRPTETPAGVEWVEVSNIFNSQAYQTGCVYSNNRYFAIGYDGNYAHTPDITRNWKREPLNSKYSLTSIAANDSYIVMLADDANDSNVKRVFTVDWRAAYSLPIHTLTFDTQGGSSIEPIVNVKKIPQSLPVPTKAGYTFLGWQFFDENYDYWDATAGDDIFADTTLYAKWEPNT